MRSSNTDAAVAVATSDRTPLVEAVERHGHARRVAANRPILLAQVDSCWYVAEGAVDLFAVPLDSPQSGGGRRTHLMTCRRGDVLFGIGSPVSAGIGLLAVGRMATTVRKVPLSALDESPAVHSDLAAALEQWIGELSRAAAGMVVPRPAIDDRIELGSELPVDEQQRIGGSRRGVVWLSGLDGASFLDITGIDSGAAAFPLHANAWIAPPSSAERLAGARTQEVLADSTWQAGLTCFHGVLMESLATNLALRAVDEYNVSAERERLDSARMRATLRHAAAVSSPQSAEVDMSAEGDPLVRAMAVIARWLSAGQPTGDAHDGTLPTAERVQRLASSAQLRVRDVKLPRHWWRRKGHTYLAWTDTNSPCALVPAGRSGYRMFDGVEGEWHAVDQDVAQRVQQRASAVYGSLTAPRLSGRNLIEFVRHGATGDVLALLGFGSAAVVAGLAAPVAIGQMVQTAIPFGETPLMLELALVLCAAGIVSSGFFFLSSMASVRLQSIAEAQLQAVVMDRLLRLPAAFFRTIPAATLARRAVGVSLIRRILARGAVVSVMGGLFAAVNLVAMAWFSPRLTLHAIGLTAVSTAIITAVSVARLRIEKRVLEIEGRTTGTAYQLMRAMAKIRVAGAERRVFSVWMGAHASQRLWMYRTRLAENATFTLISVLPPVASMVFFGLIGRDPSLSPGAFIAFLTTFSAFLIGFTGILREVTSSLSTIALFDRIRPILETAPEMPPRSGRLAPLAGRVEAVRLTFRYQRDADPVLREVSVRAEPGQFVAIAGPSGSGKSTLVRLLLGFEQPDSGGIFYDGQDLGRIDAGALRRQIGVVLQNGQLFPGSIFENIAGVESVGHDEAWEAAELAGIADEIRATPMGMFTFVSDGGGAFSGGQRQRLMIARALVRQPRVLLLDEATSALDNRTQAKVAGNIERLNMTRIVIAHRLSTIKAADLIYVLDGKGRVAEQGRYEHLMAKDGLFASMARRQEI